MFSENDKRQTVFGSNISSSWTRYKTASSRALVYGLIKKLDGFKALPRDQPTGHKLVLKVLASNQPNAKHGAEDIETPL